MIAFQDPEVAKQALDLMRELAGAVGGTTEQLWPQVVKLVWAQSVTWVVVGIVGAIATGTVAWKCISKMLRHDDDHDDPVVTLGGVFCSIAFVALLGCISVNLPGVIAPEGAAVMEMMGKLGGGR